jgi:hypothetical protein
MKYKEIETFSSTLLNIKPKNRIYVTPEELEKIKKFRFFLGGADIGSIIA